MRHNLGCSFLLAFAIAGFGLTVVFAISALVTNRAWDVWPLGATVALALYLNATEEFSESKRTDD